MTDNEDLQAKIAAIAGQINRQKQQSHQFAPNAQYHGAYPHATQTYTGNAYDRGRWAPYKSGRGGQQVPFQNRKLVLKGSNKPTPPSTSGDTTPEPAAVVAGANAPLFMASAAGEGFVKTNNKLMTTAAFRREQKAKQDTTNTHMTVKRPAGHQEDTTRSAKHFKTARQERTLDVNGISFLVKNDGSKLVRISGEHLHSLDGGAMVELSVPDMFTTPQETPKKTTIAGITFHRTKNGNLVRAGVLKMNSRYERMHHTFDGDQDSLLNPSRTTQARMPLCEHYIKNGTNTTQPFPADYATAKSCSDRRRCRLPVSPHVHC